MIPACARTCFGVRKYDEDLGRFLSCDALWEKYRNQTTYGYCANNPLKFSDPSGFGFGDEVEHVGMGLLGAAAAWVDSQTLGFTGIANVSDHPSFKVGLQAGYLVTSAVAAASAVVEAEIASGSGIALVATGGSTAPVTGTVAVVLGVESVHQGAVSAYAATQATQMQSRSRKAESTGGGRNSQHANQDAKQSAADKLEKAKSELNELRQKPNKTKADKLELRKLENQIKHLRDKAEWKGEHHHQRGARN